MNNRELAQENRELWQWIKTEGHDAFVHKANECDAYVRGEQWDDETKRNLSRRRKPALTLNTVLATYATLFGEQISRRGDVSFRPSSGGSIETARILDKLWLHFTQTQNYDWVEAFAFTDGIIRSRGFLDLRLSFDDSMQAEPVLTYLNSKDVGLYPGDTGLDPDNWTGIMVTRWMSATDIAELYGVKATDVMYDAESPDINSDYLDWKRDSFGNPLYADTHILDENQRQKYRMFRVLERQEWEYKAAQCFVEPMTGEVREIPAGWDRERIQMAMAQFGYGVIKRRVKKINWTVSVGNMLLHNAISPYQHLTPIPYFPFYIGGKPLGIIEHLRDPQNLLNKTLSQELHIVAGIANSGYKVRTGALANMTPEQLQERGGEDGLVIEVTGDLNAVEKIQPNQVPTGLDRLHYTAGELMQRISLVSDSMQGMNRADESGRAIERKAEMGSGALAPVYTSLDHMRRIIARNWLDLTQSFITEPRIYHITSRSRFAKTEEVQVNQEQFDGSFINDLTLGEYSVNITNIQSRTSADMEQFDILMQMIRNGAPIPWSDIISNLTVLENREELVDFLRSQEGRTDPSEESKQRQELELRLMAAQAADKESSAMVKQAQAQKAGVMTQKEMQGGNDAQKYQLEAYKVEQNAAIRNKELENKARLDMQKAQLDLEMARAKLDFERQKMELEIQQAREKHALEIEKLRASITASSQQSMLKQAESQNAMHMAQQKAALDHQTQQAKHNMALEGQQRSMEASLAKTQMDYLARQNKHQMDMEAASQKQRQMAQQPQVGGNVQESQNT